MKKLTTTATKRNKELPKLTVGLDLGDRFSHYCVVEEGGRILVESKVSTSPKAIEFTNYHPAHPHHHRGGPCRDL